MEKHPYDPPWWEMLWLEPSEDEEMSPAKIAKAEKALIEYAVKAGCRCASEGMVEKCERCEAWMGRAVEAPAPAARA